MGMFPILNGIYYFVHCTVLGVYACLSVTLNSGTTDYVAAIQGYQQLQCYKDMKINMAFPLVCPSVCLSVCLSMYIYSTTTGYEAAHERYKRLQPNKGSKNKVADFAV